MKKTPNQEAFDHVIEAVKKRFPDRGPQACIAEVCVDPKTGKPISRQAVNKWKEVPPRFVKEVAALTKLPRKQILPELYA